MRVPVGKVACMEKSSTAKMSPVFPLVNTSRETVCATPRLTVTVPVIDTHLSSSEFLGMNTGATATSSKFNVNDRGAPAVDPERSGFTQADILTTVPSGRVIPPCAIVNSEAALPDVIALRAREPERLSLVEKVPVLNAPLGVCDQGLR